MFAYLTKHGQTVRKMSNKRRVGLGDSVIIMGLQLTSIKHNL